MKKLMIVAAIVCAAAMSQAAQFKWTAGKIYQYGKAATTGNEYSGAATIYVSLLDADNKVVETKTFAGTFVEGLIKDGTSVGLLIGDGTAGDAGFIKQGSKYSAYYTIDDGAGHLYTSGTKTMTATYKSAAGLGFTTTGSWAVVPEPTSGLLLLLGVAGLALRRRRA